MQEAESTDDEQWVDIARFPSLDEAQENALVALAMGEAIRVGNADAPGEFDLQAEVKAAPRISDELREYAAESQEKLLPPILPSGWAKHPAGLPHMVLWAAALVYVLGLR